MAAHVYLKDKTFCIKFDDSPFIPRKEVFFDIGVHLFGFLWFDMKPLDLAYHDLVTHFLAAVGAKNEKEQKREFKEIFNIAVQVNDYCPYLYFYTQTLLKLTDIVIKDTNASVDYLNERHPNSKLLNNDLCSQLRNALSERKLAGKEKITYTLMPNEFILLQNILIFAKDVILDDITQSREKLLEEVNFIANASQDLKLSKLTPIQRLYALDYYRGITKQEPPYYTDRPFTSRFIPVKRVAEDLADLSKIAEKIVSDGIEVIEMYDIETIDDLMRFELLKMLSLGTPFKKCKHCGCYFVPLGRSDMEYCPRVFRGENKPCDEIGSIKRYQNKVATNPVYEAFNKAYKRNNSRVRARKMKQEDFYNWSEMARAKRDECLAGNLNFEDFQNWLDEGKKR